MPLVPLVVNLPSGRTATLTPASRDFPERVRIKIEGGGAQSFIENSCLIGSSTSRRMLASATGLSSAEVEMISVKHHEWVEQINRDILEAEKKEKEEAATPKAYGLVLRQIHQRREEGLVYGSGAPEEVVQLLQKTGFADDSRLEWDADKIERLVILDLDFHRQDAPKPTETDLDELGYALSPTPWMWWRTQGGGLHALYAQADKSIFNALELGTGAVAQLLVHPVVVRCKGTVELIPNTRHPGAKQKGFLCGPVHVTIPDESFACLARFSSAGANEDEIQEILDLNQMTIGQRVDHSFCLIDPGHKSLSANPVVVMDSGVYCHSCAGRLGDGFRSWGSIRKHFHMDVAASASVEPVMDAVKAFVVFEHAEYLLGAVAPEIPADCRKQLYSALLKRVHGSNPKIKTALNLRFGFVRGTNRWLLEDTLETAKRPLNASDVAVLPSAHYIDEDGKTHQIQVDISKHINSGNIPGWMPISPIQFVPVYAVHNERAESQYALTCVPRKSTLLHKPVTYLPPDDRMPLIEAEQAIQDYFPGISIQYMKALIIAVGCAERGAGPVPILWATGLTGAAKTTTVRIVQEMFGEPYINMTTLKEDRLDQVFGESLEKTRLIMFDDFAKEAEHYQRFHTFFIRLNRQGHSFHRLFYGASTVPVNSAVILTDWRKPEHFMTDPQFGRRVHIIHLGEVLVSWETLKRQLERWWKTSELLEMAAESLYSHIVDDYFPAGDREGFATKMVRLGVPLVRDLNAPERVEHNEALLDVIHDLVMSICNARPLDDISQKRLGMGYREILFGSTSAVGAACTAMIDNLGHVEADQENLHRAIEPFNAKLQQRFDLVAPAMLQIKPYGKKLYIRLVEDHIAVHSSAKRINRELFKQWPPVEPPKSTPTEPTLADVVEPAPVSTEPPPELTSEQIGALFNPDLTVPESKCGTAMTIYIDFETQSACDLKKHGSYVYAEHVTTKVICAAVAFNGYRVFWTMDYFALKMPKNVMYQHGLEFLRKMVTEQKVAIVAHNVEFERAIWSRALKLPEPERWLDTTDLTLMRGLPAGADHAGEYVLGMGKDIDGYKLMMRTCRPDRKGVMPAITTDIVQRYVAYNFRDVEISVGLADRFGIDIKPQWENDVNQLHRKINYRGLGLDKEFADTLRSFDEAFKMQAAETVERVTKDICPDDPIVRTDLTRNKFLLEWFGRRGLKMTDIRMDTLEQILDHAAEHDVPAEIISVIENRLVVTRAALAKVDTALRWASADSRLKAQIRYCIAEGTPVLTRTGWKAIETLDAATDEVWDGLAWVNFENVIDNGIRQCVEVDGVWMTPDHKILTDKGWKEACQTLTEDHASYQPRLSGRKLEDGRFVVRKSYQGDSYYAGVSAVSKNPFTLPTFIKATHLNVGRARHGEEIETDPISATSWTTIDCVGTGSSAGIVCTTDAIIQAVKNTKIMVAAELLSNRRGMIEKYSWQTSRKYQDGMKLKIRNSTLIESTICADTDPAISSLSRISEINITKQLMCVSSSGTKRIALPSSRKLSNWPRTNQVLLNGRITATPVSRYWRWINSVPRKPVISVIGILSNGKENRYPYIPFRNARGSVSANGLCITGIKKELPFSTLLKKTERNTEIRTYRTYDLLNAGPRHRFQVKNLIVSNCAAHTWRFGGFGVQPQNFKRPDEGFDLKAAIEAVEQKDIEKFKALCKDKKGNPLPPYQLLGSLVRGMIVPAPGKVFVVGDYAQVEARALLWLAEDWEGLKDHTEYDAGRGPDTYCKVASTIYGRTITKENAKERQAGKISVLACGYQGGVGAVSRFAYAYGIDFKEVGVDPQTIVDGFRKKYAKVVQIWHQYETAFRRAIKNPEKQYEAGRCIFQGYPDRVEIMLPSGRPLIYMKARIENSTRYGWEDNLVIAYDTAVKGKVERHEIYSGLICENITQAICRDFLVQAMLKVEAAGYPITLHVHDEIVAEVPEAQADEAIKVIGQIMSTAPDWAQGMPLVGKPTSAYRYGK